MTILVHQGVARQYGVVAHMHMAGQRGVVDQNAVVVNHAVVAHMHIGHQQVVIAYCGFAAVLHCAAVNGDPFADHVAVAHHQTGCLALVFKVGGVFTQGGKLENSVVAANFGWPLDYHMRGNLSTLADLYIRTNKGPGADTDIVRQPCSRIDNGARVNQTHSLRSAQMISAEHTRASPTVARQSNFQMPRLTLMKRASRFRRSPGTTGWRKRSLSEPTK